MCSLTRHTPFNKASNCPHTDTQTKTHRQRHTGRDTQAETHRNTDAHTRKACLLYQSALAECEFNEGRDIPVVKGQCLLQVGDSIPDLPCHQHKCEYE